FGASISHRAAVCLQTSLSWFFFHLPASHRHLHSFPTRRSSDLVRVGATKAIEAGAELIGTVSPPAPHAAQPSPRRRLPDPGTLTDRKSTRLNSSHGSISYAVFCLKKQNPSILLCASRLRPSTTL